MQKFLRYEIFTAKEVSRIFAIIFLQITYAKFFTGKCCDIATKNITRYFKHTGPSSLPSSVSQSTIYSVNKELSKASSVSKSDGPRS